MIPKLIHYCWFGGGDIPESVAKCIESWEKYCPDYEIKRWDESNFDVSSCRYTRGAYQYKKWAFVSDYARFFILYKCGGIYLDTDVELIRPIGQIVQNGPFMACERGVMGRTKQKKRIYSGNTVAPGLGMAATPGLGIVREILDYYEGLQFVQEDGTLNLHTVVEYTTDILKKHGYRSSDTIQRIAEFVIYPPEYFAPKDYVTGKLNITGNTYGIHHYHMSWVSKSDQNWYRREVWLRDKFGNTLGHKICRIASLPYRVWKKTKVLGLRRTMAFGLAKAFEKKENTQQDG